MSSKTKIVVFSDLDGSLLDDKYGSSEIDPVLARLLSLNVSLVLASSKTSAEIAFYRNKWQIQDPYIAENGSAVIVPKNYFKIEPSSLKKLEDQDIIELGTSYAKIREKLFLVQKQTNADIVGFGDMTIEDIANDAALPLNLAALAKKRLYSEPFKILKGEKTQVLQAMVDNGLCFTKGGRYLTALGNTDKGKAVSILKDLYAKQFQVVFTIGVGDSDNDLTMLAAVDKPFYIRSPSMIKPVWKEIQRLVESLS